METVIEEKDFQNIIENYEMVVTYFSGAQCSVCNVVKAKIEELISTNYPEIKLIEVPSEQAPELVGKYTVFSVPLIIFWIEGREYIREIRNISIGDFKNKIDKLLSLYK